MAIFAPEISPSDRGTPRETPCGIPRDTVGCRGVNPDPIWDVVESREISQQLTRDPAASHGIPWDSLREPAQKLNNVNHWI